MTLLCTLSCCPILYSLGTSPTLIRRAKMTPENRGVNGLWGPDEGVVRIALLVTVARGHFLQRGKGSEGASGSDTVANVRLR